MQPKASGPLTISMRGQRNSHMTGLLSARTPSRHAYIGHWLSRKSEQNAVSKLINDQSSGRITHIQSYDGAVRELFLLRSLAQRFPGVTFLYNFHWANAWLAISESRKLHSKLLRKRLTDVFRACPTNLRFSAESSKLAREISVRWGIPVSTYPIYTMNRQATSIDWRERKSDVLFLPQRRNELELAAKIAGTLKQEKVATSVGLTPSLRHPYADQKKKIGLRQSFDQVFELPLSSGEYLDMLKHHRVAVLPYLKDYFRWGSSGKFNEVIASGAFPLVPQDTAIASQSSIEPEHHHFPADSAERTRDIILARLAEGQPPDLKAVRFEDFLDWIESLSETGTRKQTAHQLGVFPTLWFAEIFDSALESLHAFARKLADHLYRKLRTKATAP